MKKNQLAVSVLPFLALFLSLGGCDVICEKQIDGPYYLIAIDDSSSLSVSYQVEPKLYAGRIEGQVVAVGWDAAYIVAKQMTVGAREPDYYVLTRKADNPEADPAISVEGPLSSVDFEARVRAGAIPQLHEIRGCSIK